jgi:hypothetical protein
VSVPSISLLALSGLTPKARFGDARPTANRVIRAEDPADAPRPSGLRTGRRAAQPAHHCRTG